MRNTMPFLNHSRFKMFLVASFMLVAAIACKEKKENGVGFVAGADFQMNCVRLTKAQVQVWVDSGWTMPANPDRIRALLFQFYTANAEDAEENMQLLVYPGKSWSNVKTNGRANLAIDTTCVPLKLTGKKIFANNVVDLKSMNILKPDGTLQDFDFIRFRPVQVDGEYISFEVEVVKIIGEIETYLFKGDTYPCPPHCPAGDPEEE